MVSLSSSFFPSSSLPLLLLFILSATLLLLLRQKKLKDDRRQQPPGPRGLPVIGNLHKLGKLPHRSLEGLSKTHGPIMSLRLGQISTIIVSSSEAAEQFFKTHDVVFASRPRLEATHHLSFGSKGLVFSQYGAYWRNMRKVCTLQLLSASKVESFAPLRKRELQLLIKSLREAANLGEVVDLSELVINLMEDIVYKMVLGCSKVDEFDLKGLIKEGMNLSGAFNLADYVPFLRLFDLQRQMWDVATTTSMMMSMQELIIILLMLNLGKVLFSAQSRKHMIFIALTPSPRVSQSRNQMSGVIVRIKTKDIPYFGYYCTNQMLEKFGYYNKNQWNTVHWLLLY